MTGLTSIGSASNPAPPPWVRRTDTSFDRLKPLLGAYFWNHHGEMRFLMAVDISRTSPIFCRLNRL